MSEAEPDDRSYRGRICIPYCTASGIVGIKYRSLTDKEPKYLSSVGFEAKRLFNPLILASTDREVYLCEGELDAITLHQLGLPAVAVPGVNNWDKRIWRVFRNRRVIVPADGDDNGQGKEFAQKIRDCVEDCGIILLDGHDVNSYYVAFGEKALKETLGWTKSTRESVMR